MPHATFLHGISNKPPQGALLRVWRETTGGTAAALRRMVGV